MAHRAVGESNPARTEGFLIPTFPS